jgi:O-antigen ligase
MMPFRERAARVGVTQGLQVTLVEALAATYGVGVVALFASGRVGVLQAGVLLGGPVVFALALLRPEWTILIMVALPPSVSYRMPKLVLIAALVAALFGFLLHGGFNVGPKTGTLPLVGIIVLAMTMKADSSIGSSVAAEMLKYIVYYVLLMLVAFNAVASGRIRVDTFLNWLLAGLVASAFLQPFVGHTYDEIGINPFTGKFAYLAAMGFGVAYTRFSLNRSEGRRPSRLDAILAFAFLCLTGIAFGRAAWLAVLLVFVLVSVWTRRKSIWIVSFVVLVIVLAIPVVRERILPGGTTDVTSQAQLDRLTTGRSELWQRLWARGAEAFPFGQGWGYMESLSPVDVFGFETFVTDQNPFIYAHDDFLYLFVQLGILGFGLLVVFWANLLLKVRRLSRSDREFVRYSVRVLVPVLLVEFIMQLFANGLAAQFVAEKAFMASGLVFGLHYAVRQDERLEIAGTQSLGTSQRNRDAARSFARA